MLDKYAHIVFSDGAALGNPGRGGWGTVVLLDRDHVVELGASVPHTTNNRMELTGLLRGLERIADEKGDVLCNTDSQYVINCVSKWMHGWKRNGWMTAGKTPVANRELLEAIDAALVKHAPFGKIEFRYVPGHVGVAGNERCDEIATSFAREEAPELYTGPLNDYAVDMLNVGSDEDEVSKRAASKKRGNGKAYSYLSLRDGIAMRHETWAECEKRVKGVAGCKFKKAMTPDEEVEILKSWGAKI